MTKKQHYMRYDERCKLEAHLKNGRTVPWIAAELGFCTQTIRNEIERGAYMHNVEYAYEKRYSADKGQIIHELNQTSKGRPLKIGNDIEYANFLESKMLGVQEDGSIDRRKRYSPAAALAEASKRDFQTKVCVTTLYSYITKEIFLHLTNKDLIVKSEKKHKKRPVRRIAHPALPSITDRPQEINDRTERGHKEIDLVVGKSKTKAAVLTMVDRVTRSAWSFKIPDKSAASVRAVFDRLERKLGKKRFREEFKSVTPDNGSEFMEFEQLQASIFGGKRFEIYYCHSYAAWEKGGNENYNRMFRRFFPKGTDFSKVSQKEIAEAQAWINHYPRKILGWKSAAEVEAEGGPRRG